MKQNTLYIKIVVIFLMVIGLGIFSFLVYAWPQETNASENIEVRQEEEASISAPIRHPKEQPEEQLNLKLSEALPFFLPEEEEEEEEE